MKNDFENITLIIPDLYAQQRLDQSLGKLLPEYSRTQIKEWIEQGAVLVNGQAVKPKTKVKAKDQVSVSIRLKISSQVTPENIPLSIVYEDDAILVINKPIGLIVHPGAGHQNGTLLNALLYHDPNLQQLARGGILHRLDKDTSGLLVIAKTQLALKNLLQQQKKRLLLREYQAIVCGRLISGGCIETNIGRHPIHRKHMSVVNEGKKAITHYRVLEKFRAHSLLKIRLETGRTHQIRVHMAYIHHPIVGDATYGKRLQLSKGMDTELITFLRQFKHQALHAFTLGFTHPMSSEWLQFDIPLPEDIQHLLFLLRKDKQNATD